MIDIKYKVNDIKSMFVDMPKDTKKKFKDMNRKRLVEIPASELDKLPKIQRDMAKAMGLDKVSNKKLKPKTSAKIVKFVSERLFK